MGASDSTLSPKRNEGENGCWDVIAVCTDNVDVFSVCQRALEERKTRGKLGEACQVVHILTEGDRENNLQAVPIGRSLAVSSCHLQKLAEEEKVNTEKALKHSKVLVLRFHSLLSEHFFSPFTTFLPDMDQDSLVSPLDFCLDALEFSFRDKIPSGVFISFPQLLYEPSLVLGEGLKTSSAGATVFLAKADPELDGKNLFRVVTNEPHQRSVRKFLHPTTRYSEQPSKALAEKVCSMVHLSFNLCRSISEFMTSTASDDTELDLFNDVLEVLCTEFSLDSYMASRHSTLSDHLKRQLFDHLQNGARFHADTTDSMAEAISHSFYYLEKFRSLHERGCNHFNKVFTLLGYSPPVIEPGDMGSLLMRDKAQSVEMELNLHSRYGTPSASVDSTASFSSVCSERSRIRSRSKSLLNEDHITANTKSSITNSLLLGRGKVDEDAIVLNSKLSGSWKVGRGSVCIGIRTIGKDLIVPADVCIQELSLQHDSTAVILYKRTDNLHAPQCSGTFLGLNWKQFFVKTGLKEEDVWPSSIPTSQRTLHNAQLFPAFSSGYSVQEWDLAVYYVLKYLERLAGEITNAHVVEGSGVSHIPAAILYASRKAWRTVQKVSLEQVTRILSHSSEWNWSANLSQHIDEFRVAGWILERADDLPLLTGDIFRRMARLRFWDIFNFLETLSQSRKVSSDMLPTVLTAEALALLEFARAEEASPVVDFSILDGSDSTFAAIEDALQSGQTLPTLQLLFLHRRQTTKILPGLAPSAKARMLREVANLFYSTALAIRSE